MCNFQFYDKSLNMIQNKWQTSWHIRKRGHSTWSCLVILCWDPHNVYACFVWSEIKKGATGRSCFGRDMAAHCGRQWATNFILAWLMYTICILTSQIPSCMPNEDIPKKRHRNNQYWWRYWHLLLLTVVNSEQDMLHFWQKPIANIADRCIYIWGIGSKKSATKRFNIKGDIALSCCSSPPTVSCYFPKWEGRSALISFFGNPPVGS